MTAAETLDAVRLHDGPDVLTKRAALAGLVRECLGRHDPAFLLDGRVAQTVLPETADGADDRERRRVMGAPARYAEVTWREYADGQAAALRLDDTAGEVADQFTVEVFWGAGEGAEDAVAAALASLDPDAPGLLSALRSLAVLDTAPYGGARRVEVGRPDRVAVVLAAPRPTAKGWDRLEYQAAFTVTLT